MEQLFDAPADDYDGWYLAPAGRFADQVEKEAYWTIRRLKMA
ncbi:hypothetical protein ABDB91_00520 [Desulfoscipio sp. XC116]